MSDFEKIKKMTDDELKSHLITCDYKGKDFKTEVLNELLKRNTKNDSI
jgi:23S rRNA pseudoU1915 N3-methylase RlmH